MDSGDGVAVWVSLRSMPRWERVVRQVPQANSLAARVGGDEGDADSEPMVRGVTAECGRPQAYLQSRFFISMHSESPACVRRSWLVVERVHAAQLVHAARAQFWHRSASLPTRGLLGCCLHCIDVVIRRD